MCGEKHNNNNNIKVCQAVMSILGAIYNPVTTVLCDHICTVHSCTGKDKRVLPLRLCTCHVLLTTLYSGIQR